ncbi:HK97-gp10 family putative phage morphogenesis protein [Enterococcus alishanensis]
MKAHLEYKGIDQLMNHLRDAMAFNEVKETVKRNTTELQKKMQRESPVDTGFMRRSITFEIKEAGFTGVVTPTAEYAPYVNYGTRFQSAQPFVTNSFNYQKVIFMQEMKKLVK